MADKRLSVITLGHDCAYCWVFLMNLDFIGQFVVVGRVFEILLENITKNWGKFVVF